MPARYDQLGDLHHDIDDHPFDISELLEQADRLDADGTSEPSDTAED
jgi:hypothetical protein